MFDLLVKVIEEGVWDVFSNIPQGKAKKWEQQRLVGPDALAPAPKPVTPKDDSKKQQERDRLIIQNEKQKFINLKEIEDKILQVMKTSLKNLYGVTTLTPLQRKNFFSKFYVKGSTLRNDSILRYPHLKQLWDNFDDISDNLKRRHPKYERIMLQHRSKKTSK